MAGWEGVDSGCYSPEFFAEACFIFARGRIAVPRNSTQRIGA
jgi:hypothetical protein